MKQKERYLIQELLDRRGQSPSGEGLLSCVCVDGVGPVLVQ